jgi:type IV secretion system protein VirB6/type IV secretion system protein TrbL
MYPRTLARFIAFAVLLVVVAPKALANPIEGAEMIDAVWQRFEGIVPGDQILDAARKLFWALASISLVWTLGMLIVRQDIGELLMEMLRFVLLTGIFFWFLDNASSRGGGGDFVRVIMSSFFQMSNGSELDATFRSNASAILSRGLNVFYRVIEETHGADAEDQLLAGVMAILVLLASALMAAQFLVALVMGWMLSYAGIFLLGFGGARWTSSIAVSYYKHVLAVGVALLALSFIGTVASGLIDTYNGASGGDPTPGQFTYLGSLLAALTLTLVLSIRVPQLLYTLVTGSPLGLFTGTATMAGHAIATGGSAVWASAMNALPSANHGDNANGGMNRPGSVMDAVQRSAAATGGSGDAFHINSGSDPFGVTRAADTYRHSPGGSVFASTHGVETLSSSNAVDKHAPLRPGEEAAGVHPNSAREGRPVGPGPHAREVPMEGAPDAVAARVTSTSPVMQEAASTPDYEAELGAIEASRNGPLSNSFDLPASSSPSGVADLPRPLHGMGDFPAIQVPIEDESSSQASSMGLPTGVQRATSRVDDVVTAETTPGSSSLVAQQRVEPLQVVENMSASILPDVETTSDVPASIDRPGSTHELAAPADDRHPTLSGQASGGAMGDGQLAGVATHEQPLVDRSGVTVHHAVAETASGLGAAQDTVLQSRTAASDSPGNDDIGATTARSTTLSTSDSSPPMPLMNDQTVISSDFPRTDAVVVQRDLPSGPGQERHTVTSGSAVETIDTDGDLKLQGGDVIQTEPTVPRPAVDRRQGDSGVVLPPLDNAPSDDDK